MAPPSEEALARDALLGESRAWATLIERHNRRVLVSLLGTGLPLDRARDLAQEAWARLIQQQTLGKLERLELPGLAISQARYLALTELRSDAFGRRGGPLEPAPEEAPAEPSVEEALVRREQIVRVQQALAACPARPRDIFLFVYEHPDMPHAEVAARLGLSVQRVRQTLCEVRKKLRAAAEEEP